MRDISNASVTNTSNREKPTTAVNQVVTSAKQEKRPFDKKKYRLKKYSKKFKLQQWEQKREKAVLRGYYKSIKEDEPKFDVESIYKEAEEGEDDTSNANDKINEENENNLNESINKEAAGSEDESVPSSSKRKKGKAFKKAYQEFERIKGEKNKKKEEFLRKKAEKEEALKVYKKNKLEKFKKLSRKTKKGQPIMKERMELLLEKIQNSLK
ncbi:hypothetical protein NQ317_018900 [Molorchus minor]|uniref:rRNA-processing protein FYV7 n=1 Tax=Molorchus minor TaxID=1323400 RepID=A0ABQ9JL97_9CUCU|nr:hypothetical protein NQ317_018900 [Molorchus minor]